MDYGNKFNLFDNEDKIIKLLDDAAARTGCQATNENIPMALYIVLERALNTNLSTYV